MMLEHPSITIFEKPIVSIFRTMSQSDKSLMTIENWISLVESHASNIGLNKDDAEERIKIQNEFRGDMLEILAEIFFKNSEFDDRFGLSKYEVADSASDYGVDGIGYNSHGYKCAVQCKYRANPNPQGDDQIKYEDLTKTYFDGRENHNCDLDKENTVYLFTTANDCSHIVRKNFKKKLVFIGRNELSEIIHQNVNFWNICTKEIEDYLEN